MNALKPTRAATGSIYLDHNAGQLTIANFHYTDKIKAVDIQYKAADNDKGLQILTFNWKRPKGMAHANVPDGPKQVAKGYKAALKKVKPSVRRASFPAHLSCTVV